MSTALINFQNNGILNRWTPWTVDTHPLFAFVCGARVKRLGTHLCVARAYHLPGVDPPHNNYFSRRTVGPIVGGAGWRVLWRRHWLVTVAPTRSGPERRFNVWLAGASCGSAFPNERADPNQSESGPRVDLMRVHVGPRK